MRAEEKIIDYNIMLFGYIHIVEEQVCIDGGPHGSVFKTGSESIKGVK